MEKGTKATGDSGSYIKTRENSGKQNITEPINQAGTVGTGVKKTVSVTESVMERAGNTASNINDDNAENETAYAEDKTGEMARTVVDDTRRGVRKVNDEVKSKVNEKVRDEIKKKNDGRIKTQQRDIKTVERTSERAAEASEKAAQAAAQTTAQ